MQVGAALSMVYISGAPVMFVGCGQSYTDLKKLNVKSIVKTLLKWKELHCVQHKSVIFISPVTLSCSCWMPSLICENVVVELINLVWWVNLVTCVNLFTWSSCSNNTPTCEFQCVPILLIWRPRLLCFDQQQEKLDPVRVLAKPIANSPCQVVWKLHVFWHGDFLRGARLPTIYNEVFWWASGLGFICTHQVLEQISVHDC